MNKPQSNLTAAGLLLSAAGAVQTVSLILPEPPGIALASAAMAAGGLAIIGHRLASGVHGAGAFVRPSRRPHGRLPIWIGRAGWRAVSADLADLPHLLVGGQTGAGKTTFLRQALDGLCHWSDCVLGVVDLKRVEFGWLRGDPHLRRLATDFEDAVRLLAAASGEVTRRLDQLEAEGRTDWGDGQRLVVVVDELAELQGDKRAMAYIERIARLGRAPGVHLILCTQRPDAAALPGAIKANLPATVAFKCRNRINSEILLDDGEAAELPQRPGAAIWQWRERVRVQAPMLRTPGGPAESPAP